MESGAVFCGEVTNLNDGFRIVGVDVKDGSIHNSPNVGTVRRRAAVTGIGREPDLIVCHNVDCAVSRVAWQLSHVESLVDNALERKA